MTTLADVLETLGATGLNAFWLPLAAWTLVALPLYAALHTWDRAHPIVPYHAGRALLFALPLGLFLAGVADLSLLFPSSPASGAVVPFLIVLPEVMPQEAASGIAWNLYHALGALTVVATALALWRLARLAWQAAALWGLRRVLAPAPSDVQAALDRLARQHGIGRPVEAFVTRQSVVPMTFGWRRAAIVVPAALTSDAEALRLVFVHELAHVRRRDFLLQWPEQLIGALFFVHPLVAGLRRAIVGWRERCCDAEVVARPGVSRKRYAALLLGLADAKSTPNRFALSMADVPSNLKTRILAMNRLSNHHVHPKWLGLGLGVLLLGTATLVVACSDVVGANDPAPPPPPPPSASLHAPPPDGVFMIVEDMPEMLPNQSEALQKLGECIQYPEIAKKAGIEGRVFVQFVVDEEGNMTEPKVMRGLGAGTDQEALRCVQILSFSPGMQRGKPVKVKMSLPITFRLDSGKAEPQSESVQEAAGISTSSEIGQATADKLSGIHVHSMTVEPQQFSLENLQRSGDAVTGRVVDEATGRGLAGANVVVLGTTTGSVTDADGRFIVRSRGDIPAIHVSFVGYQAQVLAL